MVHAHKGTIQCFEFITTSNINILPALSAYYRLYLLLHECLIHFPQFQTTDGLEEASAIVGAWEVGVLEHLLCDLTIELG